jgi:hypothetical protein
MAALRRLDWPGCSASALARLLGALGTWALDHDFSAGLASTPIRWPYFRKWLAAEETRAEGRWSWSIVRAHGLAPMRAPLGGDVAGGERQRAGGDVADSVDDHEDGRGDRVLGHQ